METKNTTKISLPPRAVAVLKLKQAAKAPALRVPRGVDVSPLVVVKQPVKPVGGERLAVAGDEPVMLARIAKLEAEIAELKAKAAGPVIPVVEQLARERVMRELAALVTAEKPQVKRRWWQWW